MNKLIVLLKNNDVKAFDEIYHRFVPKVHGFLVKVYRDPVLAEEVTQEVFIKIWEQRQSIQPVNTFEGYLFKIAKNKIYDLLLRQKRNREACIQLQFNDFSNELEESVYFNDLNQMVNEVINDLPPAQKTIFILSRQEMLNNNEIAQKLQLSRRTVETQLYRVLQKIKRQLSGNETVFILCLAGFLG